MGDEVSPMNKMFPLRPPPGGALSVTIYPVTTAPSSWKPGKIPTSGWNKSRLRGCEGFRVTSSGGVTMRTVEVLFWVVAPGRKRGRNEVSICSRVVFLMEYPRALSSSRWPWWPGRRSQCPMWVLGRLTVECRPAASSQAMAFSQL